MRRLLAHRLSTSDSRAAKQEWYSIVEGDDPLWEVRGARCGCCACCAVLCCSCLPACAAALRCVCCAAHLACSPALPPTLHSMQGISDAYRHIIRAFLVHFHANIMRHSTKRFDYRGGSVGNFFFAGARIFFR